MATALREYSLISLFIGLALAANALLCLWAGRKIITKLAVNIMADPATVESERRIGRQTFALLVLLALCIFFAVSAAVRLYDPRMWMGIINPQGMILTDSAPKSSSSSDP